MNGGPPAHNTRSHSDKRYRIKRGEGERNRKRGERNEMNENGGMSHPGGPHQGPHQGPHHPPLGMVNIPMGAPPPITNGFGPHHQRLEMETEIVHLQSPPNMAEPPPNMVSGPPPHYPPPHIQHGLLIPPPVLLSSSPTTATAAASFSNKKEEEQQDSSKEQQLELEISKMSISESEQQQQPSSPNTEDVSLSEESQVDVEQLSQLLTKDLFNLYSLSFLCKSKELSERRIRLDFGLVAEVRTQIFSDPARNMSLLVFFAGCTDPRPGWKSRRPCYCQF